VETNEAIKANFLEQGYHVVHGTLSPERTKEVREFLIEKFNEKYPNENLMEANIIFDHLCLYPNLIDTITNDKLVSALKAILGEDFLLMPPASCIRNSFWRLHTDLTTMEGHGYPIGTRPDFLGVAIGTYLQDCDEQGGGMFVVPRTHKYRDPLVKRRELEKGIGVPWFSNITRKLTKNRFPHYEDYSAFEKGGFDLPTKAGDTVIIDMRILHRGSIPTAKERIRTKLGIFNTAVARTDTDLLEYWLEYLVHSDRDHPFHYLRENRNIDELKQAANKCGFSAL